MGTVLVIAKYLTITGNNGDGSVEGTDLTS
jgi:hypothetical protein